MNKGISFYFGFESTPEERIKILKEVGFDCVITNADPKFIAQNGSIKQQVKLFKQYNIKLSTLHMQYNSSELPYFWTKGKKGKNMERKLIKDVKLAYKYGFKYVVTHLKGIPSQTGLNRLKRVLRECKKLDICLAVENTESTACFTYALDNIKHENLKFCYDVGHNNCFYPQIDFLDVYGNILVCLHLHDNDGKTDDHTLNKYGTIDWQNVAEKLAKINYDGNLDYEVMMIKRGNETELQVAQEVYKQACQLEKMIEKYRKK